MPAYLLRDWWMRGLQVLNCGCESVNVSMARWCVTPCMICGGRALIDLPSNISAHMLPINMS